MRTRRRERGTEREGRQDREQAQPADEAKAVDCRFTEENSLF